MTSKLVSAYEQLIVDNVHTVSTVESTIRNVTWFLPGRFNDADIASEGLYSLLSIVSSFHDGLLEKRIPPALSLPPHPFVPTNAKAPQANGLAHPTAPSHPSLTPLLPPPSEHARYTRYWSSRSKTYRRGSRALVMTTYVELLLEMVARKRLGDRRRWHIVLAVESWKTILRLLLLAITRRPVLNPPAPQREFDIGLIPAESLLPVKKEGEKSDEAEIETDKDVVVPITGTTRAAIPGLDTRTPPLRQHLYPLIPALPESAQAYPLTLLPELRTFSDYAAEILAASAALVQVLLYIRTYSRTPVTQQYRPTSLPTLSRAWAPFLIPLAMQLLARRLRTRAGDSTLLAETYAQADRRTASRFFLQGPMWVGWTRPKIAAVVRFLERIPLVGLAGELIEGYLPLVDDYYSSETRIGPF